MPWDNSTNTFETEEWHYIEAASNSGKRSGPVLGAVIHSGETPEGEDSAIGMGNWFASGNTSGSTHAGVDGGTREPSTVQYVWDSLIAHGAPGANHSHLHLEHAGTARQSPSEWLDDYSMRALDRGANVVAQWAIKYNFPLRWVSVDELRRGVKGLCTHADVRDAFRRTDHWDPGPHFPKDEYLRLCQKWYRHWMSQRPGFQQDADKPDFKVVVLHGADDPLDEGMALVYGDQQELKVLPWPASGITFETAFAVGAVAKRSRQIEQYIESNGFDATVVPITGPNRRETARAVGNELERGFRKYPGVNY